MIDHVAHGALGRLEEIGPVGRRRVPGRGVGPGGKGARRADLGLRETSGLLEAEAERHLRSHLDRGDAHLAVALRAMPVAHAEERARHPHGQVERRAARELLDVHVAAVLPGRHRAVSAGLVERRAHDARERLDRHGDAAVHARVRAVGEVPDLEERLREVRLRQQPAPRPDRGPAEVGVGLHVEDLDRQHVAGLGAADTHGTRQGMPAEGPAVEHIRVGRRPRVEEIGRVPRLEGYRVTGLDLEPGRDGVVPLVVHLPRVELMHTGA